MVDGLASLPLIQQRVEFENEIAEVKQKSATEKKEHRQIVNK